MNKQDKFILERKTRLHYQFLRLKTGLHEVVYNHGKTAVVIGYLGAILIIWLVYGHDRNGDDIFSVLHKGFFDLLFPIYGIGGFAVLLVWLGTPYGAGQVNENLWRIGLVNHAGESPFLLRKYHEKDSNITVMEFAPNGIPRSDWMDKQEKIETALDIHIIKMEEGKNKKQFRIYTISGNYKLPKLIYWQDKFLSNKDFELALGESMTGKVTVNLAKIPHILLGGSTGSGKSVLLKLLLMQSVKKGADVFIADFKGGVDFLPIWYTKCKIIIEETTLLNVLTEIIDELENRKTLLRESTCANISEYNRIYENQLKRIIFACDEVAEVLDKTGLAKEAKELVTKIEGKLSILARQGRAFGIHLILAKQRPDATLLTGQIRNNIDYRVCGRADNVLSQIILDGIEAADSIPKDSQGMFLTHDKTVFQGYFFNENTVFEDIQYDK